MRAPLVEDVKRIAVLRALVLGDMIFILPAINALRRAYPEAHLTLIARPWAVPFLTGRLPGAHTVIGIRSSPYDFEDIGFLIHPEDAAWFFPQMRAEQLDIAISMQGGGKNGNPFIERMAPRIRIGAREEGAIPLDRWLPYDYYQNEIIRHLDLAGLAGAQAADWRPLLPVLESDSREAEPFMKEIGGPFVVIHSGARDARRIWPAEQFARIADQCARQLGLRVVLTGSGVDGSTAAQVEAAMQETPVNLSERLSLPALTGLLAQSSLVISNDTGVLHLALAVNAKAVGLFWGEYISKSMPLSRDCFYPVIAWERRCPLCGKFLDHAEVVIANPQPCDHRVSFLAEITPDQVMEAVRRLLDG